MLMSLLAAVANQKADTPMVHTGVPRKNYGQINPSKRIKVKRSRKNKPFRARKRRSSLR